MATIYDVARAAGVTAATVSVALSGRGVVNRKTREHILRCAQELGYRPNLVARSLTTGQTHTIGLVVYDITNPFYGEVALAVEQTALRAGYRVTFANTMGDPTLGAELLEELAARQVDGIIAMAGGISREAIRALATTGVPVVPCMWDEDEKHGLANGVEIDFAAAARLVADYLVDLGHRRIGVVGTKAFDDESMRMREAAFQARLAERNLPLDPARWYQAHDTLETGYAAGRQLLSLVDPPTAIYAANDMMAIGVLAAARDLGVQVPDHLSVVGFDDIAMARYLTPPLTTIHVEKSELMAHATELLLKLIAGEEVPAPAPIMPVLVVRGSAAPPRADGRG